MNVKAVLFDFGDTLARHALSEEEVFNAIFAELGLPRKDTRDIKRALDSVRQEFLAEGRRMVKGETDFDEYWIEWDSRVLRKLGVKGDVTPYAEQVHRRWFDHFTFTMYPDALPTIASLRRAGLKVAVVSNGTEQELAEIFGRLAIDPRAFDAVIGADTFGAQKPEPKVLLDTVASLGVTVAEAVFIGDKLETDGAGAKAVGMRYFHFNPDGKVKTPAWAERLEALADLPARLSQGRPPK